MGNLLSISLRFEYMPLLVIMGLAWLIPMVLSVLRIKKIPSVIVEIFLGYFAGRFYLLNISAESLQILEFIGLTGFIFLMFLGGLEINMDQLIYSFDGKKFRKSIFNNNPVVAAIILFILTILLAFAGSQLLALIVDVENKWYLSLMMSTTSVGIVLPVLKSHGEINTKYGQMLIISSAVADILSITLFTFTAFIITNGFKIEITYILFLFVLFFISYRIGNRFKNKGFLKKLSFQLSHGASQLSIRGTIFLLLIFVVISQFISIEVVLLGAFLCGMLLSLFLHKGRSILLIKLDGLGYGFFIPVFFIMVGVKFDLSALAEFRYTLIPFLITLFIILFAVKLIPFSLLSRQFGLRKTVAGGFLLSSRLSLIIAASAIGLELGIVSPGINASFVIMAIATCLLGPVLFNAVKPREKYLAGTTIIVGGSSKGVLLARRLNMHGKKSVIVENNVNRFKDICAKGLNAYYADGLDPDTYKHLGITDLSHVYVDTGSMQTNISVCEILRRDFNHEKIISIANKTHIERSLKQLDVDTVDINRVMATTIESLILRPATYHALIETFENFSLEEITITNPDIDGKKVKEIPFPRDVILVMAKYGNEMFIPHGETYVRTGYVLYILGTEMAMSTTREFLS